VLVPYKQFYDKCNGDMDLFIEYIDEWHWQQDIFLKKLESNFQIFQEDMPKYIRYKEYYEPETDIRQLKQWLNMDNTDTLKAKEVTMQEIIDREGIKNYRRRAACPLCESGNDTTLSFKDKVFCCFKCGEKGDTITFVQKLHNLNFKESINYLTSN